MARGDQDHPVERARAESDLGELVLRQRLDAGGAPVLELRANGIFVMDTAETSSERSLARTALRAAPAARHVLLGGLGLGFTLAEVLSDPRVERCTVVEIEPALVAWLRDGTVPHGPPLLADGRVRVIVADVATVLGVAEPAAYDLVLFDVDNGPGHLVHEANARLYRGPHLAATRAAVRPGGVVAVWSADRAPELSAALEDEFDDTEEIACPITLQGRAQHYWLYLGRVASQA
jgi:spermidine synthase